MSGLCAVCCGRGWLRTSRPGFRVECIDCHGSGKGGADAVAVVRALMGEAIASEVIRQTQRRMIAALYWRAGWAKDAAERERPSSQHRTALMRRYLSAREMASDMQIAMEAAL